MLERVRDEIGALWMRWKPNKRNKQKQLRHALYYDMSLMKARAKFGVTAFFRYIESEGRWPYRFRAHLVWIHIHNNDPYQRRLG